MDWVDLMADVDWSESMLLNRMRNELTLEFPNIGDLRDRGLAVGLGYGLLSATEQEQARSYLLRKQELEITVQECAAAMTLLRKVWQVERGETDAADADEATLALVTLRDRPPYQPPIPEDPPEET